MGIDAGITESRLGEILKELEHLGSIRSQDRGDFLVNEESKQYVLSAFDNIAQGITDLSGHIVVQNDWGNAESYGQSIDALSARGVIPQELGKKLRSFITMNYMIHNFPTSDYGAIWDAIQSTIDDVQGYVDHVRSYLEEIDY